MWVGAFALHEYAHRPQWLRSLAMSCSHPFVASASQSPQPAVQVFTWHTPVMHSYAFTCSTAPPRSVQRTPHPPQLLTSLAAFTSQPSGCCRLQSIQPPAWQLTTWQFGFTQATLIVWSGIGVSQSLVQLPQ
jgi:hypothetical protein